MKFDTKFSRRTLVQNAGIVAGAGLLGLGSAPAVESQPASHAPWPLSETATTTPITFG